MRILRSSVRVATPWRNGGGTALEVASFPESSTLDGFGWRISLAEVRQSGLFAAFPGVERKLAVLEGRLALAVEGRDTVELSADSPAVSFPGDVPTSGAPLDSWVTHLNLMTRRGEFDSDMVRCQGEEQRPLTLVKSEVIAVLALSSLEVQMARSRFELASRDAVLLSRGDGRSVGLRGADYFVIRIVPASA